MAGDSGFGEFIAFIGSIIVWAIERTIDLIVLALDIIAIVVFLVALCIPHRTSSIFAYLSRKGGDLFHRDVGHRFEFFVGAAMEILFLIYDAIAFSLCFASLVISPFGVWRFYLLLSLSYNKRSRDDDRYDGELRAQMIGNFFYALADVVPIICLVFATLNPLRMFRCLWGTHYIVTSRSVALVSSPRKYGLSLSVCLCL